jgi:hypothetical protein
LIIFQWWYDGDIFQKKLRLTVSEKMLTDNDTQKAVFVDGKK